MRRRSASGSGRGSSAFDDIVRGRVEIDVANLGGDFVIVRADGTPLYHFTVVVDDAAMRISHVIRGEDHLSNTPKHILLFRALGETVPLFAHLPLILNPDRTKMSKRKSQTALGDYIAEGFIREGLVNYLALLGWSTGTEEEVLGLDELCARFELEAVHKGGAVFDRERLEWLNGQWIRRLSPDELVERLRPFLEADVGAGRIDRAAHRRGDPGARAARPGTPADPRCDRRSGRFPVRRSTRRRRRACSCPKRWDAATTRAGPRRLPASRSRTQPRWRSRPTSWSHRFALSPRSVAGRPVTCSWRSGWRSPVGRPRHRCSTPSSRSVGSGPWRGSMARSPPSTQRGPERPQRTRRRNPRGLRVIMNRSRSASMT